jgi:3-hydroxyacyl-[acyl-carrier-protein] dehydratase
MIEDKKDQICQFDILGIQSCQRNRYPMLFIDRITECVPLKYAKGCKLFSYNEWYFPGHFEKKPNVPGTILVESLAQCFLMSFLCTEEARASSAMSNKFQNIRFYRKVLPGDVLDIEATCTSFRRGIAIGTAVGRVNGALAVSLDATIVVPKLLERFLRKHEGEPPRLTAPLVIPDVGLCFDVDGIKNCMKNRHPWLYLDKAVDVKPGESAVGVKNFTYNEWFFPPHFPDDPNVPGFIQLETCLQAFLMTFLSKPEYRGLETADHSFDNVKLQRKIVPGDTLKIEARLESFRHGIAKGHVGSFVGENPATSFDVVVAVGDELGDTISK